MFRSVNGFIEAYQALFTCDERITASSASKEARLFCLEFLPNGRLKRFPHCAWNIEWTVSILLTGALSGVRAERLTPSHISAMFPGSTLVPLCNATPRTVPIASDIFLFSARSVGDEISTVVNMNEATSFYGKRGLVYPIGGIFTPISGILVATTPELVWEQGAVIGYMLQLSQGSCKIRPRPISIGLCVPKDLEHLSPAVLYKGLVSFAKSRPPINLWASIHKGGHRHK